MDTSDSTRETTSESLESSIRSWRRRLPVRGEIALVVMPTLTVIAMLVLLEAFSEQRLLFASLASSAFLIYLDPLHATNTVKTLSLSHLFAAGFGLLAFLAFGHGYLAGGIAMVATIVLMIVRDAFHPPAVSTSLIFAIRSGAESEVSLFVFALLVVVVLVLLQRSAIWLFRWLDRQ